MPEILTVSKVFKGNKGAHRQPMHKGCCQYYHSENWTFTVEFIANKLDECGFVIDFGQLQFARIWFARMFDHTMLLEKNDPYFEEIMKWDNHLAQIRVVPSASAEGLAIFVATEINKLVEEQTHGRVQVKSVTCMEDENNSAYHERQVKWK